MRGRVMGRGSTVLLALLIFSAAVLALDLTMVDLAVTRYHRLTGETEIFHNGFGGHYISWWDGVQDSAGWLTWEDRYEIVAVLRMENGDTLEVDSASLHFMEWSSYLSCESDYPMGYETVWISIGAKANDSSPWVDALEAGRFWTWDSYDDYYPHYTRVFNVRNDGEWVEVHRPYYTNVGGLRFMHMAPDTITEIGNNPSRFMYLVIHFIAVPLDNAVLEIDPDFNPTCREQWWGPNDYGDVRSPRMPLDPATPIMRADTSDLCRYVADSTFSLPDGNYDVCVFNRSSTAEDTVYATTYEHLSGRLSFTLQLPPEACVQNPQIVEFSNGNGRHRVPLQGCDVFGFPTNLRIAPGGTQ